MTCTYKGRETRLHGLVFFKILFVSVGWLGPAKINKMKFRVGDKWHQKKVTLPRATHEAIIMPCKNCAQ